MTIALNTGPLAGRTILITGAGGGLGAGVARAIAAAGGECILLGRRERTLAPVFDAIVADGSPQPALFPLDVTKAGDDDYRRLADGIERDCGRLDGLVHLAARFDGLMPLATHPVDGWQRILHINLTSVFALTQHCLPLLQQSDRGRVLFTLDGEAATPKAFWGAYAASKAGLHTLLELFVAEHAPNPRLAFCGIDPGPRATALRAKAFPADDPKAGAAAAIAPLYVDLLAAADVPRDGRVIRAEDTVD